VHPSYCVGCLFPLLRARLLAIACTYKFHPWEQVRALLQYELKQQDLVDTSIVQFRRAKGTHCMHFDVYLYSWACLVGLFHRTVPLFSLPSSFF